MIRPKQTLQRLILRRGNILLLIGCSCITLFALSSFREVQFQASGLSAMGEILFLEASRPEPQNRSFVILVWNDGPRIEKRHLMRYGKIRHSPWEDCSVNNCDLTYSQSELKNADAVLFPIQMMRSTITLPDWRSVSQVWVVMTDESPYHIFMSKTPDTLELFGGIFNWTMSYRSTADVPVPYGRRVPRQSRQQVDYGQFTPKNTNGTHIAVMGSNCGGANHRWNYVRKLQQYIPVDIIGGCGKIKCPGHYGSDCKLLDNYTFYLAFENANCAEYITEKLWWNAYGHHLIPVIMGASVDDCSRLLPPKSYIHVDDFENAADLAEYLKEVLRSRDDYLSFFRWKEYFNVVNEHGYFGSPSFHYCRLCEALNYNVWRPKVYTDLTKVWSISKECREPWDAKPVIPKT